VAIATGGFTMLQRPLVLALTLTAVGAWASPGAASVPSRDGQAAWQRTDSPRFEIHYLPALAPELERVVRSSERAYDHISRRLNFVLASKVPLVMFRPSGPMTREQVVAFATSDDVAPQQPHRSRIVLALAEADAPLDALIAHELTHLLVGEIILPHAPGDGGRAALGARRGRELPGRRLVRRPRAPDARARRGGQRSGTVAADRRGGGFANRALNDALGQRRLRLHREPLGAPPAFVASSMRSSSRAQAGRTTRSSI
jgi:hypothetical protein